MILFQSAFLYIIAMMVSHEQPRIRPLARG